MLKYEDMTKIEGLGWIEYELPIRMQNTQLSVEINGSINMVYFLIYLSRLISFQNKMVISYNSSLFIDLYRKQTMFDLGITWIR